MSRIMQIQPIQANLTSALQGYSQAFQSFDNAFNTFKNTLNDANQRLADKNLGLIQQYVNENNPDDPNFAQGLANLRNSFGSFGNPNEQEIAKAIDARRSTIQSRAINDLNIANTIQNMQQSAELHPLDITQKQVGINNSIQQQEIARQNFIQTLDNYQGHRVYGDALLRAYRGQLSPEEAQSILADAPGFAPALINAFEAGEQFQSEANKAFYNSLKGIGGDRSSGSGSSGSGTTSNVSPFISRTFAGEDPINPQQLQSQSQPQTQPQQGFVERLVGRAKDIVRGITKADANTGLRNAIAASETIGGNYNAVNLGLRGKYDASTRNITGMTLGEVRAAQKRKEFNAAGHYQIIGDTLQEMVDKLGIPSNAQFTPELQDYIFTRGLIKEKRPQLIEYFNDKRSLQSTTTAMAQEWAGIPDNNNKSYYAGDGVNKKGVQIGQVYEALQQDKARYKQYLAQGLSPDEALDMALLGYVPFSENQPQAIQNNIPPEVVVQGQNNLVAASSPINNQQLQQLNNIAGNTNFSFGSPEQTSLTPINEDIPVALLGSNSNIPVNAPQTAPEAPNQGWANSLLAQAQNLIQQAPEAYQQLQQAALAQRQVQPQALEERLVADSGTGTTAQAPRTAGFSGFGSLAGIENSNLFNGGVGIVGNNEPQEVFAPVTNSQGQEIKTGNTRELVFEQLNRAKAEQDKAYQDKRGQDIAPPEAPRFEVSPELAQSIDALNQLVPQNPQQQLAWEAARQKIQEQYVQEMGEWEQNKPQQVDANRLVDSEKLEHYLDNAGFKAQDYNSLPDEQKSEILKNVRKYDREETNFVAKELTKIKREAIDEKRAPDVINRIHNSSEVRKLSGYDSDVSEWITDSLFNYLVAPNQTVDPQTGVYGYSEGNGNIRPIDMFTEADIKDIYKHIFEEQEAYENSGWFRFSLNEEEVQLKTQEYINRKAEEKLKAINNELENKKSANLEELISLVDNKYLFNSKKKK